MKIHWFYLAITVLCLAIAGTTAIILFAQKPLSDTGLVLAWLFWLLLPITIYRDLFFSRYHDKEDATLYKLRKHRRDYSRLAKRYIA